MVLGSETYLITFVIEKVVRLLVYRGYFGGTGGVRVILLDGRMQIYFVLASVRRFFNLFPSALFCASLCSVCSTRQLSTFVS